mmetsp:Transcript_65737/g.176913  ORF Transcript_65737/g.176913 Transcript_65737/m.176913 type:complete len:263 (-) Transcript_65737:116-904(-)
MQPDEVLVPFLDRMNHDSHSAVVSVAWNGVGLEASRGAVMLREVKAGEELILSYGCKGNAELVLGYGFAIWGNPHEAARVCVEVSDFAAPDCAKLAAVSNAFDVVVDAMRSRAYCRVHRPGTVTFHVTTDDLEAPASQDSAWAALCKFCRAVGATAGVAVEDVLQDILMRTCTDLVRVEDAAQDFDLEVWEAHLKRMRARDSVAVGSALCATSVDGVTTALRHAQLVVVMAALKLLMGGEELPGEVQPSRSLASGNKWCALQ